MYLSYKRTPWYRTLALRMLGVGALTLLLSGCSSSAKHVSTSQTTPLPAATPSGAAPGRSGTPSAASLIDKPLAAVPFPTQTVSYPQNWPADLAFPPAFTVVQADAAPLPGGGPTGYLLELEYHGAPAAAADAVTAFLAPHGWQVTRENYQGGGYFLTLARTSSGSTGSIIVDADTSHGDTTKLLATIRL